jgi:PAS domain S-box-containing protein
VSSDQKFLERFGTVFLDSYFVVDRNRRILQFNESFVQMIGYRPAQRRTVAGQQCFDLLKLEICRERCIALTCLERNGPVRMEEIKGKTPDGRDLVLELSAVPVRGDNDEVVGVFVTHRDVTDERRLKDRYVHEQEEQRSKTETLLKIIRDKDDELDKLRGAGGRR